jgi:GNAT superfamily N-acetyltransferase
MEPPPVDDGMSQNLGLVPGRQAMRQATCSVRSAVVEDARGLAKLHVRAWQWAYRGLLPDAFLERLVTSIDRREAWRRELLSQPMTEQRTWVAERDGAMVGFADAGPCRDPDAPPRSGELYAIYLDESVVGQGVGRRLMLHALDDLRARGYVRATLWVLEPNARARGFYERCGWQPDGTSQPIELGGITLQEVRYTLDPL